MQFSPNLDRLNDLSDPPLALFDLLVSLLLLAGALLLHLIDHPLGLLLLHRVLSLQFLLLLPGRMEMQAGLQLVHLLEPAIAVI